MRRKLSFDDEKDLVLLGKALSSEIRIKILKLLDTKPYCVNEIAELLKIPASSAALNVKVLEEAQLIRTELKPGVRGSMKLCLRQNDELLLLLRKGEKKRKEEVISMPVGNYVDYKVAPTCGIVNAEDYIDGEDEPRCFIIHAYDGKAGLVCKGVSGISFSKCRNPEWAGQTTGIICGTLFRSTGL